MKIDCIVAIDPGVRGAIAIKWRDRLKVHKMPEDLKVINELLKYYQDVSTEMLVLIEEVRILPQDIHAENFGRANRITKLLAGYEKLKTVMILAEIPFMQVKPQTWQSYLQLRPAGYKQMSKHQRKVLYKEKAQMAWPETVTLETADAICLLLYAQRNLKHNPDFLEILPRSLRP